MHKNLFKKVAAGALSAAMIGSAIPTAAVITDAAESDAIFSTGFEDGKVPELFSRRGTAEVLEVTTSAAHSGDYSLCVSEREKSWNGPQFRLDELIEDGTEYVVNAYAKTEWYSSLTLSMQYNDSEGSTHYSNILSTNNDGSSWSEYSNIKFSFPAGSTEMYLYFEASDAGTKIYLDDFSVSNAPEIQIEHNIPGLKDVFADSFKIGTAITPSALASKPTMALVEKHFSGSITLGNEMKPDSVLDQNASIAYYNESGDDTNPQVHFNSAKPVLDYCVENNIPLRGHTLVWHSQTPDWFFKEGFSNDGAWVSKEKMIERMENYIKNVMETLEKEYPTLNVYAWDVVNEAWTDNGTPRTAGSNNTTEGQSAWVKVFGDNSFIEYAFKFARQYAPEGCMLYYNDYNEYISGKTNAIYEMAMDLKSKGLIDGIGMQSHLDVNYPSASDYKKALDKFASTGLDIQVTELDVTTSDLTESGFEKQAKYYKDIFDAIVEYKDSVSAVVLWGITDDGSWRASRCPLLFDAEYKAKPAFYSIIEGRDIPDPPTTTTTTTTTASPTTLIGRVEKIDISSAANVIVIDGTEYSLLSNAIDKITESGVTVGDKISIVCSLKGDSTIIEAITSLTIIEHGSILYGDANDNGEVEVADAVFILQGLADPSNEEFNRTPQGEINADCLNPGNGVDAEDALVILKFKATIITELPVYDEL